jgi:quercetin dioxygenase-like cupin family protein
VRARGGTITDMDANHGTGEFDELLTLYALDLLSTDESDEISEHVKQCDVCSAEVSSLRETAADLPYALSDVSPAASLRKRVLDNVQGKGKGRIALEQPLPGVFVLRQPDQKWKTTPFPGVEFKVLYVDPVSRNLTTILKLAPGASYPAHRHAAVEQCLVLEGNVRIGQICLEAGDFEYANAGTEHWSVQSDTGCLLMIISNQHDEIFA